MYLIIFAASLICTEPCHAYLDGGTSSMLLQLIFGGVAGALVFLKIYWHKFISIFKPKK